LEFRATFINRSIFFHIVAHRPNKPNASLSMGGSRLIDGSLLAPIS
jgi:hypothetical protein